MDVAILSLGDTESWCFDFPFKRKYLITVETSDNNIEKDNLNRV